MMVVFGGVILVLGFLVFIKLFKLVEKSTRVVSVAKSALATVRDNNLDDYQKEKTMQKNAKELLSLFFLITLGSALALAIPLGIVWVMELSNLLTMNEVIDLTLSWEFIGIAVVLSIGYFWLTRKRK